MCACELYGSVRVQVAEAEVYKLHISSTCRAQQTAHISSKTKSSTSTRTVVQCCAHVVPMSPAEQQQQQQQQLCDVREVKNAVEKIKKIHLGNNTNTTTHTIILVLYASTDAATSSLTYARDRSECSPKLKSLRVV